MLKVRTPQAASTVTALRRSRIPSFIVLNQGTPVLPKTGYLHQIGMFRIDGLFS